MKRLRVLAHNRVVSVATGLRGGWSPPGERFLREYLVRPHDNHQVVGPDATGMNDSRMTFMYRRCFTGTEYDTELALNPSSAGLLTASSLNKAKLTLMYWVYCAFSVTAVAPSAVDVALISVVPTLVAWPNEAEAEPLTPGAHGLVAIALTHDATQVRK